MFVEIGFPSGDNYYVIGGTDIPQFEVQKTEAWQGKMCPIILASKHRDENFLLVGVWLCASRHYLEVTMWSFSGRGWVMVAQSFLSDPIVSRLLGLR
jgi:hypothetical protein